MKYTINPFTGLLSPSTRVKFQGKYTEPSGDVSWNSIEDFIWLFFSSVDPTISISLDPNNSLREFWDNVADPTISVTFTSWSNPESDVSNYEYFRDTTFWIKQKRGRTCWGSNVYCW